MVMHLMAALVAAAVGTLLVQGQTTSCRTPGSETGRCVELKQCKPLRELSANRKKGPEDIALLRQSACGFTADGKPKVCCPVDWENWTPPPPISTTEFIYNRRPDVTTTSSTERPLVQTSADCPATKGPPGPNCCGRDAVGLNRIKGGNATLIDEYPWLALVEYHRELVFEDRVDKMVKTLCGGSLISSRYVLTAAHCLLTRWGKPTNVRLAEYDTRTFPKDCVVTDGDGQDCSIVLVVPIERAIAHPGFDKKDPSRRHDIGLFRLKYDAPYTDFIRPICLPSKDIAVAPPQTKVFFVAGWGSDGVTFSAVKQHVKLPYVPMDRCRPLYSQGRYKVALFTEQICAGGEEGRDSCAGDSGGPLMYENGPVFEAVGVVSFGPIDCGQPDIPGVYTHVRHYVEWITAQMTLGE